MFYERERSPVDLYFHSQRGQSLNFARHLHRSFEFIDVYDGEMSLFVRYGESEREYIISPGHSALLLPYQPHSYRTEGDARYCMSIFSLDYVSTFYDMIKNYGARSPMFTLRDPAVSARLCELAPSDILEIKSNLYAVCSDFYRQAVFFEREKADIGLLDRIFYHIEQHYTEKLTMKDIASELGYSYHYISNFFNSAIGISFKRFLNEYRINSACLRLRAQDENITEIAHRCGYDTLRSFNREFLSITGLTPSEYKRQGL